MGVNADRVAVQEGAYTYRSFRLAGVLMEQDMMLTGANCFVKIIRSDGLIAKAEFYRDPAKTDLSHEIFYDRVSSEDTIFRVVGVCSIFYNDDLSIDSVVSGGVDRTSGGDIECCSGFFVTTESIDC